MGEVLSFTPLRETPPPLVWLCKCGSTTFSLYSDGTAECASCRVEAAEHHGWYQERLASPALATLANPARRLKVIRLRARQSADRSGGDQPSP